MKLNGRPDDLTVDPIALGASGAGLPAGWAEVKTGNARGGVYAGGGLIVKKRYALSGTTTYLNPSNTTTTTVIDLANQGVFVDYLFLTAAILVRGFTGGSGAFAAKLGVLSPSYDDLLLTKNYSANNNTIAGTSNSDWGSLLSHTISATAAFKPGFAFSPAATMRLTIDGSGFTGPASAGFLHVMVHMIPLDWGG